MQQPCSSPHGGERLLSVLLRLYREAEQLQTPAAAAAAEAAAAGAAGEGCCVLPTSLSDTALQQEPQQQRQQQLGDIQRLTVGRQSLPLLLQQAVRWCAGNGLLLAQQQQPPQQQQLLLQQQQELCTVGPLGVQIAPFCLLPSPFPSLRYREVQYCGVSAAAAAAAVPAARIGAPAAAVCFCRCCCCCCYRRWTLAGILTR